MKAKNVTCVFAYAFFILGCNQAKVLKVEDSYVAQVNVERVLKDNNFATSAHSPFAKLPDKFVGLNYFPATADWNKPVSVTQPDTVFNRAFTDSKGGTRWYTYSGDIQFEHKNQSYHLPIWRESEDPSILFIMFHDLTNGTETYGGGRYIEMSWPGKFIDFHIDFNRCFNPYCHYNYKYSCPVVPKDLSLDLRIEAGEKLYP